MQNAQKLQSGIYRDLLITPGSVHDNTFLKEQSIEDAHLYDRELIADRGCIGHAVQLRLFNQAGIQLQVPYRRIQKDYEKYDLLKN